jgi:arylsulfatase
VTTPFHGEKGTTWEGGFQAPLVVRWPGLIKPGTIYDQIISQKEWMPTLLPAAGGPDIVEKLRKGNTANGTKFKICPRRLRFLALF